jgi:hypothetical protein
VDSEVRAQRGGFTGRFFFLDDVVARRSFRKVGFAQTDCI